MSSEIYYKRAYIKVRELFIPLAQHGSSNSFEVIRTSQGYREVAERYWSSLWYKDRSRVLITQDELRQMADDLAEHAKGMGIWKPGGEPFSPDEFRRWVLNGMKSACTVEEYVEAGNTLYVSVGDYNKLEIHYVYTEEELFDILKTLVDKRKCSVEFEEREIKTPLRLRRSGSTSSNRRNIQQQLSRSDHYVLLNDAGHVFCRLTKVGYMYTASIDSPSVRRFKTLKEAEKYLEKNGNRINGNDIQFRAKLVHAIDTTLPRNSIFSL